MNWALEKFVSVVRRLMVLGYSESEAKQLAKEIMQIAAEIVKTN